MRYIQLTKKEMGEFQHGFRVMNDHGVETVYEGEIRTIDIRNPYPFSSIEEDPEMIYSIDRTKAVIGVIRHSEWPKHPAPTTVSDKEN